MDISGIYKIQSIIKPSRIYIGSSKNINKRWRSHLLKLRRNCHHSRKLQRHFNKYGESDLQFSILLGCKKDDLIKTEQYFLDSYNPYFNSAKIACNAIEFILTEESKKKISESKKGVKNHNYGKKFTHEYCKKISEGKRGKSVGKGRKLSQQTKNKISESHKGKKNPHGKMPFTEITRKKISNANKGRIPWNKGKLNPHKGYAHTEEQKKKLSEIGKGKTHTEETKKKMSLARLNYYKNKKELLIINQN